MKKGIKTTCYKCGRLFYEITKERTKPFLIFVDNIIYKWDNKITNNDKIEIDIKKCSNCNRQFYKKKNKNRYDTFMKMTNDIKTSFFSIRS